MPAPVTALSYPTPLRHRGDVRFALRFAVLATIVLVAWSTVGPTWGLLRAMTIRIVVFITNLTGLAAVRGDGDMVTFVPSDRFPFSYHVVDECTGVAVMATYLIAVVAYPVGRGPRLVGLAGLPLLVVLNIARLVVLGWVGVYAPDAFDMIHLYWWQAFYVAGAGLIWFAWVWFVAERHGETTRARGRPGSPRLSDRLRRGAAVPAVLAITLVVMAAVGAWLGGVRAYGTVLRSAQMTMANVLWGDAMSVTWRGGELAFAEYGSLAAVVALFLAAPGIGVRRRIRGVFTLGVPFAFGLQIVLAMIVLTFRLNGAGRAEAVMDTAAHRLAWAVQLGVVLVAWKTWLVREQLREQRRLQRRQEARHGQTHRLARPPQPVRTRITTQWLDAGPLFPRRSNRRR